jgi:hypothetical protein
MSLNQKLRRVNAVNLMEDVEMEFEHEQLTQLATERMRLKVRLGLVEQEIGNRSKRFYVGEDGLVEVNLC